MSDFNTTFSKLIETSITSNEVIGPNMTLNDLYQAKKTAIKLSDRQIQRILGMDKNTIDPILKGTAKQVNFINLLKLAHFLGISVNDIVRVYIPELSSEQIGDIQRAKEAGFIIEHFDVACLTKIKFLPPNMSSAQIGDRIKKFFGLESIYDYSINELLPAFSRTRKSSGDLMRDFWIQSAFVQFKGIANPYPYDRPALIELMPRIRPFTRDIKSGLIKVLKALYRVGITVIFQRSIEKVQVRGATMVVDDKPCIVLSDLNKQYPTLWFTLLHELHHVLFDFDDIRKQTYHISNDETDLFLMNEEKANRFATDYLLNESKQKYAKAYLRSPLTIEALARKWDIHPSIIYSIHCFNTREWSLYSKYIPSMEAAIELINTHPFEKENLLESVKEIKELIYNNI